MMTTNRPGSSGSMELFTKLKSKISVKTFADTLYCLIFFVRLESAHPASSPIFRGPAQAGLNFNNLEILATLA
jgi:hypothetical protein